MFYSGKTFHNFGKKNYENNFVRLKTIFDILNDRFKFDIFRADTDLHIF